MTATYRIARSARRDLQEITDYWTCEAGQDIASRIISGVIETVITLSYHSQAGVAADQFGVRVRKFPAGKYMIYYRPSSNGVEILHVFSRRAPAAKAWGKSRKSQVSRQT